MTIFLLYIAPALCLLAAGCIWYATREALKNDSAEQWKRYRGAAQLRQEAERDRRRMNVNLRVIK